MNYQKAFEDLQRVHKLQGDAFNNMWKNELALEEKLQGLQVKLDSAVVLLTTLKKYRKCQCKNDQIIYDDLSRICMSCKLANWLEKNKE